jgi:hypothetical protein
MQNPKNQAPNKKYKIPSSIFQKESLEFIWLLDFEICDFFFGTCV